MRLLRRNTALFQYRRNTGETEVLDNGLHTGNYYVAYAAPVMYRGNLSVPSGYVSPQLFGVNTDYTHVLLMDNPSADIEETGLIVVNGTEYDIKAVKPSLNVLAIALKKRTAPHWEPTDTPEEPDTTEDTDDGETDDNVQSEP